jgi:hypothetical protein
LHIIGNMWALWIFGDNVEDRMGSLRFAIFYLACGLAAAVTHLMTQPESTVPTVGASGAIAGVLGAYLLLFPTARLVVLFPVLFFPFFFELPAVLYLGARGFSFSCSAGRWRWPVLRKSAASRFGHTSGGLRQGFSCVHCLCDVLARDGCNLMSTASSGRGSRDVELLKKCYYGHFLAVFYAGGASACDHTTVAGGVAEATDRPN